MSKLKKLISWLAIGLLGITLAACGQRKSAPSKSSAVHVTNRQVRVVATDTIIGDITKNIAGKHAQIHVIVPTGQDPHEYDPLPADVRSTSKADVIFYNGVNLENAPNAWFTKLQKNIGPAASKKSHAVSDGIDVIYLQGKNETGKEDPHAWLNLANGIIYAKNIAIQLSAVDPQHKTDYQRNMKRYTAKLARLDAAAKTKFAKIPANKKTDRDQRRLLQVLQQSLQHPVCLYLGNQYGRRRHPGSDFVSGAQAAPSQTQVPLLREQRECQTDADRFEGYRHSDSFHFIHRFNCRERQNRG